MDSNNNIVILDGGMGRYLKRLGAPFKQPEWSALALIENPDYVAQAHTGFIEAGADIITTNSYAVVPFHIGEDRFKSDGDYLIYSAAKIARQVANESEENVKVAGSIPPAFGSYKPESFQKEQADAIYQKHISNQKEYVDFWLAETVSSIVEADTIGRLVKKADKPLWISYSLKDRISEEEELTLRSGESVEEAVKIAIKHDAKAILFNCSQPEEMAPAIKIARGVDADIQLGAYANSFDRPSNDRKANEELAEFRQDLNPDEYLNHAKKWVENGATIIGGCCGIYPEHIEKLNNTLKNK